MSRIRVSTLANGMRVATDPMDHVETVSVGVWVEAGSRFEAATINGVSHFLEHMAFKGTRRRDARADRRGDRGGRRPSQRLHLRASRPPSTPRC